MDTYEVLSLLFLGGSFLIALLAYIDRRNKRFEKRIQEADIYCVNYSNLI